MNKYAHKWQYLEIKFDLLSLPLVNNWGGGGGMQV